MNAPSADESIEAVDRAVDVIDAIRELNGAGVTELAEELGWPKSTVHTHLQTLYHNELVIRAGNQYDLSLRFIDFGEYVKQRQPQHESMQSKLDGLAAETGCRVQFIKNEHGNVVVVCIAEGKHAVSTGARLGRRTEMLHATASGKAILANLPDEELEGILDKKGLPRYTENTITERDALYEELAEIRDRGYAINNQEHIKGLRAIAAPITTPDGEVVGAVSVADAAHRMKGDRFDSELPELLLGVVNEIELDVAYS
jgi:DNA-binding IclR family transcriptional regulator